MSDIETIPRRRIGRRGCNPDVVRNFAPSWHGAVMGTGALAITLYSYQGYVPIFSVAGRVFFCLTGVIFVFLAIPWVLRWIVFTKNAMADLRHPVMSNFYPTITAGIVVLGMNFTVIGGNPAMGIVLWIIGSLGTLVFSVVTPYLMFTGSHVKLDHINPGSFIPSVALLAIPLGGAILLPHVSHSMIGAVVLFNFFGLGAGFFLYLAFFAVTIYRFVLHEPLPETLVATVWINIGPLGAAAVAIVNIAKYTPFITVKGPYFVAALLLWGFGAWWLIMAGVMTIHHAIRGRFPYSLSWWGLTFPTGAFVLASHDIAVALAIPLLNTIGFGMVWLLSALWLFTLIKTVQKGREGSLFAAPPAPAPARSPAQ